MELENIILSEVIQVQKAKSYAFSYMWNMLPNYPIQIQTILRKTGHAKGKKGGKRRKLRR
jgi:hypothetical protein